MMINLKYMVLSLKIGFSCSTSKAKNSLWKRFEANLCEFFSTIVI